MLEQRHRRPLGNSFSSLARDLAAQQRAFDEAEIQPVPRLTLAHDNVPETSSCPVRIDHRNHVRQLGRKIELIPAILSSPRAARIPGGAASEPQPAALIVIRPAGLPSGSRTVPATRVERPTRAVRSLCAGERYSSRSRHEYPALWIDREPCRMNPALRKPVESRDARSVGFGAQGLA